MDAEHAKNKTKNTTKNTKKNTKKNKTKNNEEQKEEAPSNNAENDVEHTVFIHLTVGYLIKVDWVCFSLKVILLARNLITVAEAEIVIRKVPVIVKGKDLLLKVKCCP